MAPMSTGGDQGGDDPRGLLAQKEEFLESFFRRGAEFARELLEENDRLRRRVLELEERLSTTGAGAGDGALEGLAERIARLEKERAALLERFSEIEQENNDLASLLVAQSQLHASLDAREVLQVIVEVLLNFVGAQRFAVLLLDESETLRPLVTHGVEPAAIPARPRGEGVAGQVLASDEPYVAPLDGGAPDGRDPATAEPLVCFPLKQSGGTVGVVAIWSFLPQKHVLADIDTQIFTLIAGSGSRALEAARLASDAAAGVITPPRHTPFEVYAAFVPEAP
jgi:hypothetical protein